MPGYVLCEGGRLLESGFLSLTLGTVETRLHALASVLRNDTSFDGVELLIVERIPPFLSGKGGGFRTQGVVNLHMGVGVVLSVFGNLPTIWIPPVSWKTTCRRMGWELKVTEGDSKDEYDALVMLYTVMYMAGLEVSGLEERIHTCLGIDAVPK